MKIIRTGRRGGKRTVAKYDGITTATAHAFMVKAAEAEANNRRDCGRVDVQGGELSGNSRVILIHDNKVLAYYTQQWD